MVPSIFVSRLGVTAPLHTDLSQLGRVMYHTFRDYIHTMKPLDVFCCLLLGYLWLPLSEHCSFCQPVVHGSEAARGLICDYVFSR
jgi:hypothetical protein